jgi:hypothetical protein
MKPRRLSKDRAVKVVRHDPEHQCDQEERIKTHKSPENISVVGLTFVRQHERNHEAGQHDEDLDSLISAHQILYFEFGDEQHMTGEYPKRSNAAEDFEMRNVLLMVAPRIRPKPP